MILNCAIKRDYLGILYLLVWHNDAINIETVLVDSTCLAPSPDFCYAFCLRNITKRNFLMQATEFHPVEEGYQNLVGVALSELPLSVKIGFLSLEYFNVGSNSLVQINKFLLKFLPSSSLNRARLSAAGDFGKWCSWIDQCFKPIKLRRTDAGAFAFYATLVPSSLNSRIVHLVSRTENDQIEEVIETLLKGKTLTNHGVTMSSPVAKRLLESLKVIKLDSSFLLQRAAFYLQSLCSLVFQLDGLDWFEGFEDCEVAPLEQEVSHVFVFASVSGVDLSGDNLTRYADDMVSFDLADPPKIAVNVEGTLVEFPQSLISPTGHVVWGDC